MIAAARGSSDRRPTSRAAPSPPSTSAREEHELLHQVAREQRSPSSRRAGVPRDEARHPAVQPEPGGLPRLVRDEDHVAAQHVAAARAASARDTTAATDGDDRRSTRRVARARSARRPGHAAGQVTGRRLRTRHHRHQREHEAEAGEDVGRLERSRGPSRSCQATTTGAADEQRERPASGARRRRSRAGPRRRPPPRPAPARHRAPTPGARPSARPGPPPAPDAAARARARGIVSGEVSRVRNSSSTAHQQDQRGDGEAAVQADQVGALRRVGDHDLAALARGQPPACAHPSDIIGCELAPRRGSPPSRG